MSFLPSRIPGDKFAQLEKLYEMTYVGLNTDNFSEERDRVEAVLMIATGDVLDFEDYGEIIPSLSNKSSEEKIIGKSKNYLLTTADNMWSLAVVIQPKDIRKVDQREIQNIRSRCSHALKKHGYEVYKRTGPWTSEKQVRW